MSRTPHEDQGAWIRSLIGEFMKSPKNTLGNTANDKVFDMPIVGFASGGDPIYVEFKRDIGNFYMTPLEAFRKAYPESYVASKDLTVISWVMPHIKQTKLDNRKEKIYPSERWARGKKDGVLVNIELQKYLIEILKEAGHMAMAPCLMPYWSKQTSEKYGYASTWSERHVAYAAGLGTFGLCDGLITPVGKAMRCGSIVAEMAIPPTKRPYKKHTEYCLFLEEGSCGLCMARCPVGAITKDGHDKEKCSAHADGKCVEYIKEHFGFEMDACGLCQTKVPCESGIPKRKRASQNNQDV